MSEECPLCDYSSSSKLGVKQHLSSSHDDYKNPYKSKTTCKNCDDSFWILGSYLDMGKGTFCSKTCKHEYGRVYLNCKNCGVEFIEHKNSYNRRNGNGTFCSLECKSDHGTVEKDCKICGETFSAKKALVENNKGKYCSRGCYYIAETKEGTNIRDTQEYNEWRKSVKNRDECCVECGSTENLHAHHIIPVSEDKDKATDISNGEALCDSCHANKHPEISNLILSANRNV